jgi:hypothetical protein
MPKTTIIAQTEDPDVYRLIDRERGTELLVRSVALTSPEGTHEGYGLVSEARPDHAVRVEDGQAALYWAREADGTLTETPCTRYSCWERVPSGWVRR